MQVKDTESSWICAISCCHFLRTSVFALTDLGTFENSNTNAARPACKQTWAATALSGQGYRLWERAGPQKAGPETSTGHSAAKPLPRFRKYFDSLLIDIVRAWLSSILKHIECIKETVFCVKVTYSKSYRMGNPICKASVKVSHTALTLHCETALAGISSFGKRASQK